VQEGQQLLADRVSAGATRHAEQDDLHGVHHPAADPKPRKYSAFGAISQGARSATAHLL